MVRRSRRFALGDVSNNAKRFHSGHKPAKYPRCITTARAVDILGSATNRAEPTFWPGDLSLLDALVCERVYLLGPKQVTDAYLLALAVRYDGCLATLDTAVQLPAVHGATPRHLVVI